MSMLGNLLNDPPPASAFEMSEQGVAFARTGAPQEVRFQPLPAGAIQVSPLHDNIQQPDAVAAAVARMVPAQPGRRRRAALILPDFTARVAVVDFDRLPDNAEEQRTLIRFRMKKSVPFDLDEAVMSYYAQPARAGSGKVDVVVAVIAREVVSRYESALLAAGFHAGQVLTSSLAALNLLAPDGITVFAKLSGPTLSVVVLDGASLKLVRCVELEEASPQEIMSVLHPTMVYIEDELGSRAGRIVTCGFPADRDASAEWAREWGVTTEPLRSKSGAPTPNAAGLVGYMESFAA